METLNINIHVENGTDTPGYFHTFLDLVHKRVIRVYDASCSAAAGDVAAFHIGIPLNGSMWGSLRAIAGTEKKYVKVMARPFTMVTVNYAEVKAERERQHEATMAKLNAWTERVK